MKISKLLLLFAVFQLTALASLKLPGIYTDNMIIQQNSSAVFRGWADPGEIIRISSEPAGLQGVAAADTDGRWETKIKTPAADNMPMQITISSRNDRTVLHNVLLGEVWLASGQSNMNFPLFGVHNADAEVKAADFSNIRLFAVPQKTTDIPQKDIRGAEWMICNPQNASGFSAVGYYFAVNIHRELGVPVGIICSAVGGTPIEAWMDRPTLEREVPQLAEHYDTFAQKWRNGGKEIFYEQLNSYEENLKTADGQENDKPAKPRPPMGPEHMQHPCGLYNGMIEPVAGYTLRGFIWYQGEGNSWRAKSYIDLSAAMVELWREKWHARLPFYFVQIAPCSYYDQNSQGMENICSELREAQRLSLDVIPDSGMAVSLDTVDDIDDIHPRNKKVIGRRLALIALNKTYGRDVIYSGPVLRKTVCQGSTLRLTFDHAHGDLVVKDTDQNWFEIAGDDGKYYPADVKIDGDSLLLSSEKVQNPSSARYAWSNTAGASLFNGEGLPASSFRTDNSQWQTDGKWSYF
jgi:sialate O-acetylesterase